MVSKKAVSKKYESVILIALGLLGIILCHIWNKNREVEWFYKDHEPAKFRLFVISYSIVITAILLNLQYLCVSIYRDSYSL